MRSGLRIAIVAAMLVAVLGFQALGAFARPEGSTFSDAREVTGRAAFAYVGGLRTFAAAVLWNRLEPQFHEYYQGASVADLQYMIPTLAIVQALDPQFVQSYYLSSYVVAKHRGYPAGLDLAREGVRNNPRSGLLRANLAQLLLLDDPAAHREELKEQARVALGSEVEWMDDDELYEGVAIFRDVLRSLGDEAGAQRLEAQLEKMKASGVGAGDHDHDGDGEQDH